MTTFMTYPYKKIEPDPQVITTVIDLNLEMFSCVVVLFSRKTR